jgi:hypothetical protein
MYTHRRIVTVLLALTAMVSAVAEEPQQPPSVLSALAAKTIPGIIDLTRNACRAAAERYQIVPLEIAELPESVTADMRAVFPASVIDRARIYFGLPLNDPAMGIGLLNNLGMLASKGGFVLGMTFGDEVYMFCPLEALTESPAGASVLVHELVHVAQYQALGYEKYKQTYAEQFAGATSLDAIGLEYDAYRFQRIYPNAVPRGFFAFYPVHPSRQVAQLQSGDNATYVPLTSLDDAHTETVQISELREQLPRHAVLLLSGTSHGAPLKPQLLDPFGGPPLYEFEDALPSDAAVRFNERLMEDGPAPIVVGTEDGAHIVWRDLQGTQHQWVKGSTRFADTNEDDVLELIQTLDGQERVWWWVQKGFTHLYRDLHRDAKALQEP